MMFGCVRGLAPLLLSASAGAGTAAATAAARELLRNDLLLSICSGITLLKLLAWSHPGTGKESRAGATEKRQTALGVKDKQATQSTTSDAGRNRLHDRHRSFAGLAWSLHLGKL